MEGPHRHPVRRGARWGRVFLVVQIVLGLLTAASCRIENEPKRPEHGTVVAAVNAHARAWETGDTSRLRDVLHDTAHFAYPRSRVDRATWAVELDRFARTHRDTRIYIHRIVVEDPDFAVEWQFATTDDKTGRRTAVSDAVIGRMKGGRIVLWKEYLDGRVPELQRRGELGLDEGETPFPWPRPR